jgi:exodeoxyribonuclease VII small subunit
VGKLRASFTSTVTVSRKPKTVESTDKSPDFEKSLAELELIVTRMEAGELSLDESLQQFERGIALARTCQQALQTAEQKVEMLLKKSGGKAEFETVPFASDNSDDDIDE